jgi:tetratricopeptide (TPR) repeat protein
VSEEQVLEVEETPPPPPSLWQRFRLLFAPDARLHQLSWAISVYPDSAANYVLRGELLLERGEAEAAIQDFRRALELATQQVETEDWGVVAQAVQDRALVGLGDALYRCARYNRVTDPVDDN